MPAFLPEHGLSRPLYRAINPLYARTPLSGRGAQLYGGRFNPKGVPALYCALTIMTALREANQVGALQPLTLVSYDAEIDNIFDGRDQEALAQHAFSKEALADSGWRETMRQTGVAPSQAFARRLAETGFRGLLVRSFAPGTGEDGLNLVLWQWSGAAPSRLTLVDDENRLGIGPA